MNNQDNNQNQIIRRSTKDLKVRSSNLVRRGLDVYDLVRQEFPIRLMHIDDIYETRENVRILLEADAKIEIIASTGSSIEAIRLYRELSPHIVLQDIHRPEMDGFTCLQRLKEIDNNVKSLILSVDIGSLYRLRRAKEVGAMGGMSKPPRTEELLNNIHLIHSTQSGSVFLIDSWMAKRSFWVNGNYFDSSVEVEWDQSKLILQEKPVLRMHYKGKIPTKSGVDALGKIPFSQFVEINLDFPYLIGIDFDILFQMENLTDIFFPSHLIETLPEGSWNKLLARFNEEHRKLRGVYVGKNYTSFKRGRLIK